MAPVAYLEWPDPLEGFTNFELRRAMRSYVRPLYAAVTAGRDVLRDIGVPEHLCAELARAPPETVIAQAARDLEPHKNMLRRWTKELSADPAQAFPGHGQERLDRAEVERLRREVAKLRAKRGI